MSSRSRTSLGDSADFEGGDLTLNDRLKAFKSSHFDPDAYVTSKCQTMNEKEIRHLCSYMVDLKKASAEEMRRSVYANYGAFIRTSREISDLEGELLSIRNLLSTQAALVHGLAEGVRVDSLSAGPERSTIDDTFDLDDREPSKIEKWLVHFMDTLEVLLAEKRVDEALAALDEGERVAEEASEKQALSQSVILSLQYTISEQRQLLADQLAETACKPSTRGAELHLAILALKKLGDSPRAHTLLLNSHHQKLKIDMQRLRPSHNLYGAAYTSSLSQLVFSTIAQAASDSLADFGEEPAYASELVTWAVKQIESFALVLKRHTLGSSAASGGLRAAAECVQICLGYGALLEARGLALSPVLLRFFRPFIEQALSTNLRRIEQSSATLAAADDWSLVYVPAGARTLGFSSSTASLGSMTASQPKLSSSAHRFNYMVQEFLEEVGPLESLQLGAPALEGLLEVFNCYINILIKALPSSVENEENPDGSTNKIVRMAETEDQQIALLANASLLADELIPRAVTKLSPLLQASRMDCTPKRAPDRQNRAPEQREWKRRLQRSVDRLRDSFCRQHALELIFNEDGEVRLSAEMYLCMDAYADEPQWFPSPVFQELFCKVTRMASIASDMFIGRERFATILMMRLIETVILWLSNDQSFWEDIEEGQQPLGPLGLQQLYLDMEFVILFSSQSRYLSRNLHQVIKGIIGRAVEAVGATGIDPYSALPEDEWFADVAQIAIKLLTGKANFGNIDQDMTSPTPSM